MQGSQSLIAFNRGRISRLAMARVDLKRTALSAAIQTNWMPRVLGSMMLRPGLGYLGSTRFNSVTRTIPFVFSSTDTAVIEATSTNLRFWVNDALVTRSAVTATITNGEFGTNITGWTDADEAGATSDWVSGGYMGLTGTGTNAAIRYQLVTVVESGTQHSLRISVTRGPVTLRIGSTIGGSEFLSDASLGAGEHSITFTPTANFYIQFSNTTENQAWIDRVAFDGSGVISLTSPWFEADLSLLRWYQSGDVIFVACEGKQQYKIERRSGNSWSCVKYQPRDGPFLVDNTSTITITASAITGNITLTASRAIFKSTNVGGLYRLRSVGQTVSAALGAENTFTNSIRVTGTGEARRFGIVISGTFTATVTLQYSTDNTTWQDHTNYTTATSTTLLDGLDNQIVYYRIGIKTGNYTSGTANATLSYSSGSITGTVRITGYTSETSASAEVLTDLGGTAATSDWAEGAWSDRRGWPSAVVIHDGRLFWAGKDKFWGSVTDQFETFDDEFEGDAGPINRSIGYGPVDSVNWMLSLNRLMAGTAGSEIACRSSSFNEPLTPTNFTPKDSSTQGSARVPAIKVDNKGLFVQRNGRRLYEMVYDAAGDDYVPEDLTLLIPEIGDPGIVAMAAQRKPDTRIHAVRSDGTVGVLVFDRSENVICWVDIETTGDVEDVCILPGSEEDAVYYVVKRTIGGTDYRFLEKWATESEARGAAINKVADSFVYAAAASNTITGLSHLEGQQVVAWGGGLDLGTFTVSGGSITLHASTTYTHRCAGLTYQARYKSSKLAYAFAGRSGLTLRKKINTLAVILADAHPEGLRYGPSFDWLDSLPQTERYAAVNLDEVWEDYDAEAFEFSGEWDTDARLCLVADAPRSCTVLAALIEMDTNR
jgi:hypothetical protein